ncbi:tripartite tricarboxylate transporter TctB family protein [Roseovarius sp. S4756]|uniref:tripartite tricarboxylate transporter TctB family protein n=1 Tax=Roseovarius maritimus TaxID=3342637 RepID=UPI00372968B4
MARGSSKKWRNAARKREMSIAGVLIIAAAVFALVIIPQGVVRPSSVKHLPLSPVFLPYVLAVLVVIFAALHLVEAWIAPDAVAAPPSDDDATHPRWKLRVSVLFACLLGYLILPDMLGMLATAIMITIGLMFLAGERRPLILTGVGILMPVLVWLFFTQVAQVPLPDGFFEAWR